MKKREIIEKIKQAIENKRNFTIRAHFDKKHDEEEFISIEVTFAKELKQCFVKKFEIYHNDNEQQNYTYSGEWIDIYKDYKTLSFDIEKTIEDWEGWKHLTNIEFELTGSPLKEKAKKWVSR